MIKAARTCAALSALLMVTACQREDPNALDATAFEAIAFAADVELNEPIYALYAVMGAAAAEPQVGWDSLVINLDGTPEPVNWWLLGKGWIQLAGAQFINRPVFNFTEPALTVLAAEEPWFTVLISEESQPEVDCASAAAMATGGCEVFIDLQPVLTDEGRRIIGARTLDPVRVYATVRLGLEDWDVSALSVPGDPLYQIALTAILGPPAARAAAHAQATSRLGGQVEMLTGALPAERPGWSEPNYIDPPEPVAPIGADQDPRTSLGLGLPDAAIGR